MSAMRRTSHRATRSCCLGRRAMRKLRRPKSPRARGPSRGKSSRGFPTASLASIYRVCHVRRLHFRPNHFQHDQRRRDRAAPESDAARVAHGLQGRHLQFRPARPRKIRHHPARGKETAALPHEGLPRVFRARAGRPHYSPDPASEHARGFSFSLEPAPGRGRATGRGEVVLEIDRGGRESPAQAVKAPEDAAPRAVIFDMDGLMIDSEVIYQMAWRRAIREFEREMPDAVFRRFLGRTSSDSHTLLADIFGPDFDVGGFLSRCSAIADDHIVTHGIPHKPGLGELLDSLESNGTPKAVATSTRREWALRSL